VADPKDLTDAEIAELERLERVATESPLPWRPVDDRQVDPSYFAIADGRGDGEMVLFGGAGFILVEDRNLAIAAVNALPALLAEVRRSREMRRKLEPLAEACREAWHVAGDWRGRPLDAFDADLRDFELHRIALADAYLSATTEPAGDDTKGRA
jgi:hypothetical protein